MLQRQSRLAKALYWATTATLIVLPGVMLGYLLIETPSPRDAAQLFPDMGILISPSNAAFWGASAVSAMRFVLFAGFLWQLRQLFGLYRGGHVLTHQAAHTIQSLGKWLMALAVWQFLSTPLQTVLLT